VLDSLVRVPAGHHREGRGYEHSGARTAGVESERERRSGVVGEREDTDHVREEECPPRVEVAVSRGSKAVSHFF